MARKHAFVELHRAAPWTVDRLEFARTVCVAGAGMMALTSLVERALPATGLGWAAMPWEESLGALAMSLALGLSLERAWRGTRMVSAMLAIVTAACALLTLAGLVRGANGLRGPASGSSLSVAAAYLLLAIVLMFMHTERGPARYVADAAVFASAWIGLVLTMGAVFGAIHLFGAAMPPSTRPASLIAVTGLTFAAFAQRAEHGWFSIFVGRGVGSRMARFLLPVILALPFVREMGRARLYRMHLLPDHYSAAVLASMGTMISLLIVVFFSRQFRRLEADIQDLSLRDELTGLYNLRGFQLLADQTMRTAKRSALPFSVLFVDVDNLKKINDTLGHGVGSRMLVDAAEFLKANFRESDVIGRIGGDEFAVAGHFTSAVIEAVEDRLEQLARGDRAEGGRPRLGLSMGHVTAGPDDSLDDLLHRADAAMYQRKRMKKLQGSSPFVVHSL